MQQDQPRIAIQLLDYAVDWLVDRGVAIEPLLAETGINPLWLREPERLIPLESYVRFFERASVTLGMPYLGLQLGQFADVGSLGALGHLFSSAPSLFDAVDTFTSHVAALQEGTINRVLVSDDCILIQYRIQDDRIGYRRQDAEYSVAATDTLVRLYTHGRIRPREVYFEHCLAGDYARYRHHFGCDVFFDQPFNTLVYNRESFNVRNSARNRVLNPIIASHLDTLLDGRAARQSFAELIERIIEGRLPDGHVSQVEIAAELGMSVSTMIRRLKAEKRSFRAILLSKRLHLAQRMLLEDDRSVAEIALAVGYSETASFTRAFRQERGVSPNQYRLQARTAAHGASP